MAPRSNWRARRASLPAAEYFETSGSPLAASRTRVPARGLLLENQVGPHAAAREVAHAVVVLGAVGVRVEVARIVVADVLEKLDEEERGLDVGGAEAEVLVVAPGRLIVQVDVK